MKEEQREKVATKKTASAPATSDYICGRCGHVCHSRIGLLSHERKCWSQVRYSVSHGHSLTSAYYIQGCYSKLGSGYWPPYTVLALNTAPAFAVEVHRIERANQRNLRDTYLHIFRILYPPIP